MRQNLLLAIVIIAALIASGFFVINYFKKSTTLDEIEEQIADSNEEIQELTISNESLATEIDDIKSEQTIIQDAMAVETSNNVSQINSNEIIRNIMELGLKNGTSIIPLSNSGWLIVKIEQSDYQILKLNLSIEGNERSIINFIKGLQGLYPTLVIETFQIKTLIDIQTTDSETTNQTSSDDRLYSNLSVVIYSK